MNTAKISMSPQTFKEIVGQEKAISFLQRAIASNKVAPAYLFTGIQGIGKTTTAKAFALLINCLDPVDGDGCRRCSSCRKMIDGNHPDFIVIEPDKDKKAIGIHQIRDINRQLAFSPALERYRIIIVDPAERMTDEASNAFLKALEEPPPYNIFILNVRDPRELLPTIISRCQKISFRPLPTEAVVNWLIKKENIDKEKAQIIAKLSEGSLGKAEQLSRDDFFTHRVSWITMLNSVINKSSDMLIDLARELSGFKKSSAANKGVKHDTIAVTLGIWKSWYRDILLFKLEGNIGHSLNFDLSNDIKDAAKLYTIDSLMMSLGIIARAEHDLMENKNPLFLLERSLLGLKRAITDSYV